MTNSFYHVYLFQVFFFFKAMFIPNFIVDLSYPFSTNYLYKQTGYSLQNPYPQTVKTVAKTHILLSEKENLLSMESSSASNSHIPLELTLNILHHLPVKSLVRFLCISKQWRHLISSQDFIKKHLKLSIESNRDCGIILRHYDDSDFLRFLFAPLSDNNQFGNAVEIHSALQLHILHHCDGLVCLSNEKDEVAIWNPLIRKYRKLPREPVEKPSGFEHSTRAFAFGYDPQNDDYKVLRVVEFYNAKRHLKEFEVKAYSLKAQSWKKVEEQWPYKKLSLNPGSASLNGAVHWLVDAPRSKIESLIAFNLATEKFRFYRAPDQPDDEERVFPALEVLGRYLCYSVLVNHNDTTYHEVWLMKEYGVESSWTQIYRIGQGEVPGIFVYRPLMFSKNGKEVLLEEAREHYMNLVWYDMENKTGQSVENRSFPCGFTASICTGSLLLLDGDNVIDPR